MYNKTKMDKIYTFGDLENIQSFILSLKRKANKLGVTLQLDNKKHIEITDNIKVCGFFMERIGRIPGILATATGLSIAEWLPILVHESCHMDQWQEKISLWKECGKLPEEIIDNWIEGKNYTKKTVEHAIKITRNLELDCEQRAVKKIKRFNLPINIDEYIQRANVYLFFHNWVLLKRKWYNTQNEPFTNQKIYGLMNKDWYESYDEMPPLLLKAFKKYKI